MKKLKYSFKTTRNDSVDKFLFSAGLKIRWSVIHVSYINHINLMQKNSQFSKERGRATLPATLPHKIVLVKFRDIYDAQDSDL